LSADKWDSFGVDSHLEWIMVRYFYSRVIDSKNHEPTASWPVAGGIAEKFDDGIAGWGLRYLLVGGLDFRERCCTTLDSLSIIEMKKKREKKQKPS